MARDKLITIRIEGDKRDLFNQLAKSQNTDTASLLYDFISGCLSGTLDIGIVTGKKQRIDKIANQIDSDRIDKLEMTTQEIGERLDKLSQKLEDWIWVSQRSQENNLTELKDQISILAIQLNSQKDSQETTTQRLGIITKKLNDWIAAIDDRLTDSDQGLSEKITSLEHRLNALAIRLDTQGDSQEMTTQRLDSIDTDSQQDSQEIDMEPLLQRERECSIAASPLPTGEPSPPDEPVRPATAIETVPKIETVEPDSTVESVTDAIEYLAGDNSQMIDADRPAIKKTQSEIAQLLGVHSSTVTRWKQNKAIPSEYLDKCQFNDDKSKILWIYDRI